MAIVPDAVILARDGPRPIIRGQVLRFVRDVLRIQGELYAAPFGGSGRRVDPEGEFETSADRGAGVLAAI